MSFKNFKFDPKIEAGIAACGYTLPTPIQKEAIPPILDGKDMLGLAQTGTGSIFLGRSKGKSERRAMIGAERESTTISWSMTF